MTPPQLTVLIVDDEEMNVVILKHRLEKEGFKTAIAYDGQQALDWMAKNPLPSLVLMDLMMPILDGWQATDAIKQKHPDLPILAVSAKIDERTNAISEGFDGFIAKPIDFKQLVASIKKYIDIAA